MAEKEDNNSVERVKFAISAEDLGPQQDVNENNKVVDNSGGKRASRFQVARVDHGQNAGSGDKKNCVAFQEEERDTDTKGTPGSPGPGDTHMASYDTHNQRTFAHNTLETLPHVDHYRNLLSATGAMRQRPTLLELHEIEKQGEDERLMEDGENGHIKVTPNGEPKKDAPPPPMAIKFGWITGVLVRCLLNIYGVMLFLRLSWVVGQAGLGFTILIILLAGCVTTITSLSMSAICTNGDVKGGGAYFMISRSLGPEFGGAIGIVFSVANAVAIAMYVVGFAETIRDILKEYDMLMIDEVNDVRVIGLITVCLLLGIALMGMEWEAKAQLVLLGILVIALANFAIGTFLPPTTVKYSQGYVGYRADVMNVNLGPDFREGESFFSVFSIFFPAATGILAGANISGDLKDAQSAIPKGTLLAILISTLTYIVMAWMVSACVVRDAPGLMAAALLADDNATLSASMMANASTTMLSSLAPFRAVLMENDTIISAGVMAGNPLNATCVPGECEYGLQNNMQVAMMVSAWAPITIAGIISATLSSALASLVSAPKVFQAVCKDKLFPGIHVFAKGYGKSEEPRRAYLLAFGIGAACICIGELNAIAPLISNFFLMSYALINYSCFDASLAKSPGWRPAFKYYSMWMALLGAVLCLAVMFVINWWAALVTFAIISVLYVYTHYRKPDVNWGSSRQAHVYRSALQNTLQLVSTHEHVKNFRPQMMVLTGFPGDRPALVDFATNICKNISLMVCGHVLMSENLKDNRRTSKLAYAWLHKRKSKGFYTAITAPNLRQGSAALLQCSGVGKLRPNTLLIGFKHNWNQCNPLEVDDYFNIIHDAFNVNCGVGVLRISEGLDYSHLASLLDQDSLKSASSEDSIKEEEHAEDELAGVNSDLPPYEPTPSPAPSLPVIPPPRPSPPQPTRETQTSFIETSPLHRRTAQSTDTLLLPSNPDCSHDTDNCSRDYISGSDDEGLNDSRDDLDRMDTSSRDDLDRIHSQSQDDLDHLPHVKVLGAPGGDLVNKEVLKNINRFHRKQKKGFIDVWWMFDDGGLTLLIPYILSNKSAWKGCKLRVFMAGTKTRELDRDQRHMATLLSKFRIEYSSMTVIPDIAKRPQEQNIRDFKDLISEWMVVEGETQDNYPWKITENELAAQKDKTNRHIRLNELLKHHSGDSTLIVMTLPMPRKGLCSAGLYMAWIDTITKDLPPVLLLRGNQQSVLTYYS